MQSLTVVTHNGPFQADDVFSVAFLKLLNADKVVTVIRSRDTAAWEQGDIVVDVGGVYDPLLRRFDHHQTEGAGQRPNGVPFSSFGLVWKEYGLELLKQIAENEALPGSLQLERAHKSIDAYLVQAIDAEDVGIPFSAKGVAGLYTYGLDELAHAFHPTWKEDPDILDSRFNELVAFAQTVLSRECIRALHRLEGDVAVQTAYETATDKRLVVLDRAYSIDLLSEYPEPLFVVRPDAMGAKWMLNAVQDLGQKYKNRKDLPAPWAGLTGQDLAVASGVSDALFCHRSLFIAIAKSREGAEALGCLALNS